MATVRKLHRVVVYFFLLSRLSLENKLRRWRRFVGLGDDACSGDGKVWRPFPVQLDHPIGKNPPWLQFRGRYGATGCITSEAFWKFPGEPLRRCSAEVGLALGSCFGVLISRAAGFTKEM